jgi:hypothetical protein
MPGQEPTFLHHANPDGTFNSICMICFHTIATGIPEESLANAETEHRCAPSLLTARLPKIRPD